MRHGMTIGELAGLFNEHFGIGASFEVVRMEGWRREMYADATGLPWVMPSPNMPTLDTAIVYPGTVLFEGTMLSEGRGTTRPFELVGAPWIEAERFAREMNALGLPGAYFRPAVFEPTFQKHAKQPCGGCQIHVTDRAAFRPVLTGVALIDDVPAAEPGRVRVAAAAVRVRARQDCRSTSWPDRARCGSRSKRASGRRTSPTAGGRRSGVSDSARAVPIVT